MRLRALPAASLAALVGCSTTPPPALLSATLDDGVTVELRTDPLALRLLRDGQVVVDAPAFVEVGTTSRDPALYVDAAAPKEVTWKVPARATGWDGKTLTLEGGAHLRLDANGRLTLEKSGAALLRFVLPIDEDTYGLGEQFDSPASQKVVREMQLRLDVTSESGTNEVHVPVPLALWPVGRLGAFADEKRPGAFDLGVERAGVVLISFATQQLALQLYGGDAPGVLDHYTRDTGRPLPPPEWALGPMQWRNEGTQADVLGDAQMMRALGLPGSTIWIDNPWQTGYQTFEFDPARYPDPATLSATLAQLGYKLVVWSSPYLDAAAPTDGDHAEAAAGGFLVTDGHGRPYDFPWQNGPGALVDFSAAGAVDFFGARIGRATAAGVSGFKLDFGEDLVPELGGMKSPFRLAAGGTDEWHNAYAGLYHSAYLGAGAEFLITRAGAAGTQSVTTCVWPGDLDADFSRRAAGHSGGLPSAVAAAASLSASGFPFFASDIGGFRGGTPSAELLARWTEAACTLPVMQLGGGGSPHLPWDAATFGPDALAIYTRYARLHTDLFPYLATLAQAAASSGAPIVRAPGLMVPGQPYEDDFFVGDSLFVAPVVEAGAVSRTVTLPPGDWIDWWTGELANGAVTADAPIDVLPLWRKAGAMVPLLYSPVDSFLPAAGYATLDDAGRPLRMKVAPRGNSHLDLYDGTALDLADDGSAITVSATPGRRHTDVEFDLDSLGFTPSGSDLPAAADDAALAACGAPGCWIFEAGVAKLRVVGGGSGKLRR